MSNVSMDLLFWVGLLLKMALTASIIVAASIAVERSGAFIGAMIAALPTAAGATYIILAVEHTPAFIAQSAVGSIAANPAVAFFALTYAWLARSHGLLVSLGASLLVWVVCATAVNAVTWTLGGALLINVVVYSFTIAASAPIRAAVPCRMRVQPRRFDIPMRALTVALFVAVITTLSHHIGSFLSGMLAVFPVAMASFMVILHPRIGGEAAGSVLAHAQAPLLGLIGGFALVNLLAQPIGVWWAFLAGLAASVGWNAFLWTLHRSRARARPQKATTA